MSRVMPTRFRRVTYTWTDKETGVQYAEYPMSITDQIFTEDGISLTDVLETLCTSERVDEIEAWVSQFDKCFRLLGTLMNDPSRTSIEKLYSLEGMKIGDTYLVESTIPGDETLAFEIYTWAGSIPGWLFMGCSRKESFVASAFPNKSVLDLIPPDIHATPGTVLTVSADGTSLEWLPVSATGAVEVDGKINLHNTSPEAHADIRAEVAKKGDRMIVVNDILDHTRWTIPPEANHVEYIYTHPDALAGAYFDIAPVIDIESDLGMRINDWGIQSFYEIQSGETHAFAILKAKKAPTVDIPIIVKIFNNINPQNNDESSSDETSE